MSKSQLLFLPANHLAGLLLRLVSHKYPGAINEAIGDSRFEDNQSITVSEIIEVLYSKGDQDVYEIIKDIPVVYMTKDNALELANSITTTYGRVRDRYDDRRYTQVTIFGRHTLSSARLLQIVYSKRLANLGETELSAMTKL